MARIQGSRSQAPRPPAAEQEPDVRSLNKAVQTLNLRKTLVGQMPITPPTLRGHLGAVLVKIVRRSLFWFTSRLDDFHTDVVEGFEVQFATLKSLITARERTEQILIAEAAERRALSFAVAENARALGELKALYRPPLEVSRPGNASFGACVAYGPNPRDGFR